MPPADRERLMSESLIRVLVRRLRPENGIRHTLLIFAPSSSASTIPERAGFRQSNFFAAGLPHVGHFCPACTSLTAAKRKAPVAGGCFFVVGRYPFKPLVLMPSTIYFWKMKNTTTIGSSDSVAIANMPPQLLTDSASRNSLSASDTGYISGLFK